MLKFFSVIAITILGLASLGAWRLLDFQRPPMTNGHFDDRRAGQFQKVVPPAAKQFNAQGVEWANHGDTVNAREAFIKALAVDPAYPEALNNLGSIYYQQNRWEEAAAYYHRALEFDPSFANGYYNLAHTLANLGLFAEARPYAATARVLGPDAEQLLASIDNAIQNQH